MMDYERDDGTVRVRFRRDFNLLTARHLRQVTQGAEHVRVDLSDARIVDTEALAALWKMQDDDIHVTLYDPPALFHDMVDALDLEGVFEIEVAHPS
jgi:ABC-type transporter Mla MlaB component